MDKNHRILIFFDSLILGATLVTWAFWAFSHQIGLVSGLVVLGSLIFARWTVTGSAIPLTDGGNRIVAEISDELAHINKAESQRMPGVEIEKYASQGFWFTSQILVAKSKLSFRTGQSRPFHDFDAKSSTLSAIILMRSETLPKPMIGKLTLGDQGLNELHLSDVSADFAGQIEFQGDQEQFGWGSVSFPDRSAPIEFELRVVMERNDLDYLKTLAIDPENYKKLFIEGTLGAKNASSDEDGILLYSLEGISFEFIDTETPVKAFGW